METTVKVVKIKDVDVRRRGRGMRTTNRKEKGAKNKKGKRNERKGNEDRERETRMGRRR